MEPTITYEPNRERSAAYIENKNVGECCYIAEDNVWTIVHTFVRPELNGQGIATKLVAELVQQARSQNIKIEPQCVFARKEFREKPEYADVLKK